MTPSKKSMTSSNYFELFYGQLTKFQVKTICQS